MNIIGCTKGRDASGVDATIMRFIVAAWLRQRDRENPFGLKHEARRVDEQTRGVRHA